MNEIDIKFLEDSFFLNKYTSSSRLYLCLDLVNYITSFHSEDEVELEHNSFQWSLL